MYFRNVHVHITQLANIIHWHLEFTTASELRYD